MSQQPPIEFTKRDRVMRAWQNTMELVRDFQQYSAELQQDDPDTASVFADFAEDECHHAAHFREVLHRYDTVQ